MATPTPAIENAAHRLAGKRMSGAEMIVQVLADEGVDTIFGYSGGAILPTYDAVFRFNDDHCDEEGHAPMPLIVPANEQGAGFMLLSSYTGMPHRFFCVTKLKSLKLCYNLSPYISNG